MKLIVIDIQKGITDKYYNEMMWPERFASCISFEDAIKMMETDT